MAGMDERVMDLEKGVDEEAMGADAQIPAMAAGGEKELLIPDLHVQPIDGGVVPANMNHGHKKWLPCWLVVAGSVILLTNHIHAYAAPKDQLFPPELAIFTVFLCAICLMLRAVKQMI